MPRKTKAAQEFEEREKLRESFQKIHHAGATEFGGLWLTANDNVLNRVRPFIDTTDVKMKTIVSAIILSSLRSARAARKREGSPV
jgi:hypothetical protein